ncbi:PREDICTED: C3 and PZP-like alpha-2-macroglobulin domain-containing protein 8 [Priapulus caudatus]|uniref:C3 and PZP-like alpha-2-macroglobulin domain-containing protein 8 n=1 Tax=Priapulus caudatus TaxID=37621 RepID=A0ABM1EFD9_PRICU|nr:PREDICTED: C3 and PZP-like alpha-2-macroglobulin domain-containing protein 8 [Priapulus caudatus]
MCVSRPHELRAFKPLFVDLHMPYAAVRHEQIEIRATVFNYGDHDHDVQAVMTGVSGLCSGALPGQNSTAKQFLVPAHDSATVSFLIVPLKVGEFPVKVTVVAQDGAVDIVQKILRVAPEGVEKVALYSAVLDPSGQLKQRTKRSTGESNVLAYELLDDTSSKQTNTIDLTVPEDAIPDTDRCSVTVMGDLLGATVQTVLGGMGPIVDIPTGCGEQTMIHMAPAAYSMYYLQRTGQLTDEMEKNGQKYLIDGYNQELSFRTDDGSFSVWPHLDSSTWLTAFVLKVFCQAEEFIYVDKKVTCVAMSWIIQQQKASGAFDENYKIWHKEMMGGLNGEAPLTAFVVISMLTCNNCEIPDLMSSVAGGSACRNTSSLPDEALRRHGGGAAGVADYSARAKVDELELICEITSETNQTVPEHVTVHKNNALVHRQHTVSSARWWEMWPVNSRSIVTSSHGRELQINTTTVEASTATGVAHTTTCRRSITQFCTYESQTVQAKEHKAANIRYWPVDSSSVNENSVNWYQHNSTAVEIESTAYALLAMLREEELSYGNPIVEWLIQQRNAHGGFLSTQDTVVALQALADYSARAKVDELELICEITSETNQTFLKHVTVHKNNALVQQQHTVPTGGELQINTTGRGVGQLQVELHYHVPSVDTQFCTYDLTVQAKEHKDYTRDGGRNRKFSSAYARIQTKPNGRSATGSRSRFPREATRSRFDYDVPVATRSGSVYILEIETCVRYLKDTPAGMTILDIGIFTGFEPIINDLELLVNEASEYVQHFEQSSRGIIVYLEQVPSAAPYCLKFRARREFNVGTIQAAPVKVFNYYEPGA